MAQLAETRAQEDLGSFLCLEAIKCNAEPIYDALVETLKPFVSDESSWWGKYSGLEGLKAVTDYYKQEINGLESKSSLDSIETARLATLRNKKASLAQELIELEKLMEPSGSLNLRQ